MAMSAAVSGGPATTPRASIPVSGAPRTPIEASIAVAGPPETFLRALIDWIGAPETEIDARGVRKITPAWRGRLFTDVQCPIVLHIFLVDGSEVGLNGVEP
jgi:hypothetical protein